jgi:hypothetical protein
MARAERHYIPGQLCILLINWLQGPDTLIKVSFSIRAFQCREIKIFHANAATFPIPQGPLFIFLYNPFGRQVMRTLVKNVSVSFQQNPRRIILVYFHPLFADEWKKVGFFIEIRRSKEIAIYDTQSSGAFGHAGHKSVPTIFSSLHIILKGLLLGKELLLKRLLFRHNMNNAFYA